jgi:hypothetical protein
LLAAATQDTARKLETLARDIQAFVLQVGSDKARQAKELGGLISAQEQLRTVT